MKVGMGCLKWPPTVFWTTSLAEFDAAHLGYLESIGAVTTGRPMKRSRLNELMAQYPDTPQRG